MKKDYYFLDTFHQGWCVGKYDAEHDDIYYLGKQSKDIINSSWVTDSMWAKTYKRAETARKVADVLQYGKEVSKTRIKGADELKEYLVDSGLEVIDEGEGYFKCAEKGTTDYDTIYKNAPYIFVRCENGKFTEGEFVIPVRGITRTMWFIDYEDLEWFFDNL